MDLNVTYVSHLYIQMFKQLEDQEVVKFNITGRRICGESYTQCYNARLLKVHSVYVYIIILFIENSSSFQLVNKWPSGPNNCSKKNWLSRNYSFIECQFEVNPPKNVGHLLIQTNTAPKV